MKVKILIVNAHSSRNKGDAGIILSMIDSMKRNIPNCQIKIKTRFPDEDRTAYDVPVSEAVHNVIVGDQTSKFEKLKLAWGMFKILKKNNGKPAVTDPDYEWADVVVSCGGGFLLTHGFSVMTLQHLVQLKIAFDYKKPVIIYSQSIGPLYNKIIAQWTKNVLDKVEKIFVREKISEKLLQKMKVKAPIEVVPDSAFSMDLVQSDFVDELVNFFKKDSNAPLVGVTVRDWKFPEVEDSAFHRKKYIKSIQAAIHHLETKYGAKVLLMPQVLGPNAFNDDRNISREILNGMSDTKAQLIDIDFHPRELKYFYSKMDMFIGTRMHSNIFALSSGVPTVAINYEHKTRGIMELLDLKEYVLDISGITPEDLIEAADKCWRNRNQLHSHLEKRIPGVILDAQLPAMYLNQLMRKKEKYLVNS